MRLRLMPIAAALLALACASGAAQAQSKAKRDARYAARKARGKRMPPTANYG